MTKDQALKAIYKLLLDADEAAKPVRHYHKHYKAWKGKHKQACPHCAGTYKNLKSHILWAHTEGVLHPRANRVKTV
jgi:hypothetical protein